MGRAEVWGATLALMGLATAAEERECEERLLSLGIYVVGWRWVRKHGIRISRCELIIVVRIVACEDDSRMKGVYWRIRRGLEERIDDLMLRVYFDSNGWDIVRDGSIQRSGKERTLDG